MDEHALPAGATEASRIRYALAKEVTARYRNELGREIALTGSVSRGVADEDSDIELAAWVDDVPSPDERRAWIREIGGTELPPEAHTSQDGTVWEWSRYRGVWLETGWQAIAANERVLQGITAGDVIDHRQLVVADAVAHAVALRTEGRLARWQEQLSHYPDRLQARLITQASRRWTFQVTYWTFARRSDRVGATERLLADATGILRILFALNRVWEPTWKWTMTNAGNLTVRPDRLTERLDAVFCAPDLEQRLETCAELFLDTLTLVPPPHDVSVAMTNLRKSLRTRSP